MNFLVAIVDSVTALFVLLTLTSFVMEKGEVSSLMTIALLLFVLSAILHSIKEILLEGKRD